MRYFFINLHRQLLKRLICLPRRSLVFFLVTPVLISILLMQAFMGIDMDDCKFLFFAGLYAFWLGLFASCQSINGDVSSGEWGYWVLGNQISTVNHFLSVTISVFVVSLIQIIVFVGTCVSIDLFLKDLFFANGSLISVFVDRSDFKMHVAHLADSSFLSNLDRYFVAVCLMFLSLVLASVSGISLGLFFSVVCKDMDASIRLSVAATVFLSVVSATVLNKEERFPLLRLASSERAMSVHTRTSSSILEKLSFILPQRYFYNVGRILNRNALPKKSLEALHYDQPTQIQNVSSWTKTGPGSQMKKSTGKIRFFSFLTTNYAIYEILAALAWSAFVWLIALCALSKITRFQQIR